jgi:diguanylate cyclase (GGDEF)-like protein
MTLSRRTVNPDSSLRRRLLFGSISLAVAVSIIFIIVAYRLASDLGESVELQASNKQLEWFFSELKALPLSDKNVEQVKQAIKLSHSFQSLDQELVALNIWFEEKNYEIRSHPSTSLISKKVIEPEGGLTSSGTIDSDEGRLFWGYQSEAKSGLSLLLVRRITSLDTALDYVTSRLSITAFLTFWLAIWAALIMSAIIAKRFEENNQKLSYLAMHDPLTGLRNRTFLMEYFANFLADANRLTETTNKPLDSALLLIDLNKFKDVNDTYGHAIGDQLLCTLASRIQLLVGEEHVLVRYGGDEFIVWMKAAGKEAALALSEQILVSCSQAIPLVDNQFEVGASIGIAFYPQHGANIDSLFKHADIAMFQAKRLRLGVQIYQADQQDISELQVRLRGQLNSALALKQFKLLYQPKVSLPDGRIYGAEALARWQHPTEGLLAPDLFISLIEQGGIVHSFSRFVVEDALMQISTWLERSISLCVSVNLSAYNLADNELVTFIQDKLEMYKVPANLLEVELTESATMVDIETTKSTFAKLRKLGVKLSIDDFGTGMSSFAYIKQLDVDYVKIDRSFIANVMEDRRDELIVQGLISMCHSLNKSVIAEGVENVETSIRLHELGCMYAQGYHFGRPMDANELFKLVNTH